MIWPCVTQWFLDPETMIDNKIFNMYPTTRFWLSMLYFCRNKWIFVDSMGMKYVPVEHSPVILKKTLHSIFIPPHWYTSYVNSVSLIQLQYMMTSSNGHIFCVTGHLCGELTGHRWIPHTQPVTRGFDVFFDLHLNKRLSKQWWGWWFETPSRPLWRHCNDFTRPSRTCESQSTRNWPGVALDWWCQLNVQGTYILRELIDDFININPILFQIRLTKYIQIVD